MNPANLVPSPDAIPAHWGWFQLLLIVTFTVHLLFMNAMLGMGILALVREFKTGDDFDRRNRSISVKLPYSIAFTVNVGVAPLLFLQVLYGHFVYTSSILMAVYWLSVILFLIIAYYSAYIYNYQFEAMGHGRKIFIAVSVILLLWIAFVFSTNMVMMIRPDAWTAYFSNPFGTLLIGDPMLLPRYAHFVLASVAVAGLFEAIVWKVKNLGTETDLAVRSGLNWFTWATVLQFAVGIWFLLSLPEEKMMLFMGRSPLHTALLGLGVLLGIGALVTASKGRVWMTTGITLGTVLSMVLVRDLLRSAYLSGYFSLSSLKVIPEYSPMILFLVSFVAGIAIVVYMLKLAASAGKEG